MAKKPKTTTRSYTLGLLSPSDASDWLPLWNRLFQTHHAVCRGAREYGEFYLNLRGGLAASLADCADEPDAERRRLLQRGARRMLSLGWLSVESARGAENHPHRVRERVCEACGGFPQPSCERGHPDKIGELKSGQSLLRELAQRLLLEILSTHKGVRDETEIAEWSDDCVLALTARIRPDAVIVNRAAAFAEWQQSVGESGAEMPEQARRILFAMCGDGFASLTLPEEEAVKQEAEQAETDPSGEDDSEDEDAKKSKSETEEAVEPSNASRGVYCDLFGGDPGPKIKREGEKIRFAAMLHEFLSPFATANQVCVFLDRTNLSLGEMPRRCDPARPLSDQLREWRTLRGWDRKNADLLPREASPDNKKNKIAVPYRKLLVAAGLWPKSNDEGGATTPQHEKAGNRVQKKLKEVAITTGESPSILGLVNGILNACAKRATAEDLRVFKPEWAKGIQDSFERAARVGTIKGAPEFRYLMFALAARRISQTQTWTKRNEAERHKAAVKEDAAKKALEGLDPTEAARKWFAAYEEKRGEESEALSDFQITRRMIGECDAVFKAWRGTETADEREKATASVQSKVEKFGDARFYADLSEDPAAAVIWQHEQGPELLKQWIKLRQAQHDQRRFKIPRFCHPDPFHHPTWCEFGGSSKPKVWYAWKPDSRPQSPEPGGDADGSRRLWMLLPDFAVRQAKPVPMRWRSKRLSQDLGGVREHVEVPITRADRLSVAAAKLPLLDANRDPIRYRPAHPFTKDAKGWNARLQLDRDTLERLERHWDEEQRTWRDDGKALRQARWFVTFAPSLAASDGPGRSIHPKLGWKASPHSELNKKQKREGHAKLILSRLPGLRVLSVDLGHRYAAACAVWETPDAATFDIRKVIADTKAKGWKVDGSAEGLFVHIHEPTDKIAKNGRNKDKPVIETTIYRRVGEDFLRDPKTGTPTTTPHPAPWARLDRQFLIKLQGEEKPAREASNAELWLVHQIERDMGLATPLIDRLVQNGWGLKGDESTGERQPLRIAALRALGWVPQPASRAVLNGGPSGGMRRPSLRVDELMSETVRNTRLALYNHGDAAKIAFGLTSEYKPLPGDRKYWFNKSQDNDSEPAKDAEKKARERAERHTQHLQDMLVLWHDLAVSTKWRNDDALAWWNDEHAGILPLLKQASFTPPPLSTEDQKDKKKAASHEAKAKRWKELWEQLQDGPLKRRTEQAEEDADRAERKADREAIRSLLAPVAETLRDNPALRQAFSAKWVERWKVSDGAHALVPKVEKGQRGPSEAKKTAAATGWHARLRALTDWIMGRRLPGENSRLWSRNVGGLSLTRIATMRSLYQLHKAFAMRSTHDNPRGAPEKGESNIGVAQGILVAMERMREQRVKQLASRIAASALGLGGHWKQVERRDHKGNTLLDENGKPRMKRVWVEEPNAKYSPCHAVVIENLRNYRFVETQPRRENKALMSWSAGKVRKYLEEACQLHGLHLREVMPNYTSRQCSRTALPGARCVDVPVDLETGEPKAYWWKKSLNAAKKKTDDGNHKEKRGDAESRFITDLAEYLAKLKGPKKPLPKTVRVPRKGGDIFVAAPPWPCGGEGHQPCPLCDMKRASQADLNAAANIGLRALFDPDFIGRWWYVPACMEDGWRVPASRSCTGAACLDGWKVAPKDGYYSADAPPLAVADDETVKKAQEAVDTAKRDLDAAKMAARKRGADQSPLKAAVEHHKKAKNSLKDANTAASQKKIMNIWQDSAAKRMSAADGRWYETTAYWNIVRSRVIDLLRAANGLAPVPSGC
ncbi:MAG: type V CRISPR-associated protein Cas12b [Phycisphaerae bacterium]|nr:type V CRISPR-associated protein Cas12b [Phycisphaerae bacterium]